MKTCLKCKKKVMKSCYDKDRCQDCHLFTNANDMDPGDLPEQLTDLSFVEQQLIAKVHPVVSVYRIRKDFQSIRVEGSDGYKDFQVRRQKVYDALVWLKMNNPFYEDIELSTENIQLLPEDGNVYYQTNGYDIDKNSDLAPLDLEGVHYVNYSELEDEELDGIDFKHVPDIGNVSQKDKIGHSFEENVLLWPSIGSTPLNEFGSPGYITMAFPHLFPFGKADYSNRANNEISLTKYIQHLMLLYDERKDRHNNELSCRFGFPRELRDETELIIENDELQIHFRCNDILLNKYNAWVLQTWRSNIDFTAIVSEDILYRYIAKYAAKCEIKSECAKLYYVRKGQWVKRKKPAIVRVYPRRMTVTDSEYTELKNDERDVHFEWSDSDCDDQDENDENEIDCNGWNYISGLKSKRTEKKVKRNGSDNFCWDYAWNKYNIDTLRSICREIETIKVGKDYKDFDYTKLSLDQQFAFNHFKDLIDGFKKTGEWCKERLFFVQGRAGYGKSFLLNALRTYCFEKLGQDSSAVVAYSGVAAKNVDGETIHSFLRIPPKPQYFQEMSSDTLRLYQEKKKQKSYSSIC
ncbi:ATP-dependent DNA helicase [Frankliniella fusca]|uniref:ATP-dependent DNA helicase n=1 Tax=Frankliniella fusca TaxID=407009 RepID=A0AAE1GQV2_9NEOP|nr:ATP-dependent DNA helicase [Frankliniella fusca]